MRLALMTTWQKVLEEIQALDGLLDQMTLGDPSIPRFYDFAFLLSSTKSGLPRRNTKAQKSQTPCYSRNKLCTEVSESTVTQCICLCGSFAWNVFLSLLCLLEASLSVKSQLKGKLFNQGFWIPLKCAVSPVWAQWHQLVALLKHLLYFTCIGVHYLSICFPTGFWFS